MEYSIVVEVDDDYCAKLDAWALEAVAAAVLRAEGIAQAEMIIVVTSDEEIQSLNRAFRGVDAPTDVLSFAADDGDETIINAPPELQALLEDRLGDIVIAFPYAEQQAGRYGNSVVAELQLLTAHGVLHLLGYDHATPEEEAEMWERQEKILAPFGVTGLSMRRYEE